MLDSTTVAAHEGKVYCKTCHGKSFGPKGYGFGGGAGALSTETGKQHGVKEGAMSLKKPKENKVSSKPEQCKDTISHISGENTPPPTTPGENKPTDAHIGGSSGPGPHCPRCGKTVYENEKAIGISIPFHKGCSKCKSCNKSIDYNTMAEHEGDIYCKGCYAKNFGPHGFGVGSLA